MHQYDRTLRTKIHFKTEFLQIKMMCDLTRVWYEGCEEEVEAQRCWQEYQAKEKSGRKCLKPGK